MATCRLQLALHTGNIDVVGGWVPHSPLLQRSKTPQRFQLRPNLQIGATTMTLISFPRLNERLGKRPYSTIAHSELLVWVRCVI